MSTTDAYWVIYSNPGSNSYNNGDPTPRRSRTRSICPR